MYRQYKYVVLNICMVQIAHGSNNEHEKNKIITNTQGSLR